MLDEIKMYSFNENVKVYFTNKKVVLPQNYIYNIKKYWNSTIKGGKKFFNGNIFTIKNIKYINNNILIFVDLTDYAHFLYTFNKGKFEKYDCRVIHTSVLIETADKKYVIGVNGNNSFTPQKLQFIGGGLDKDDINGHFVDLEHNIKKEIYEELGLDIKQKTIIKDFKPYLLKTGGKTKFLSAIFKLDLYIDEKEFSNRLEKYNEFLITKNIIPEINSLFFIKNEKETIINFIKNDLREKDENLIPTLKAAVGITTINNFNEKGRTDFIE